MPSWKNILKRIADQDVEKAPPHVHSLKLYDGKLTEIGDGRITYEWAVNPDYMNPASVFGGYLATLADQTCSFALMTLLPDDQNFTTADLNIHYFRPVTEGTITCVGEVVNLSRNQAYVEATFTNDAGKIVLKARAVERLLKA